jgi:hypothetical protein
MSRAYRLKVRETLRRVLRASDHVSTRLELLEILPQEQMAELLTEELVRRGFRRKGKSLVRQANGTDVTIEPATGTVTVGAEAVEHVELEGDKEGSAYGEGPEARKAVEADLRKKLRQDLEGRAKQKTGKLQKEVTDRLEAQLGDLQKELDQVVNRVTAEALKRKAAQIGQIKEMTEDPQSGSLTIVLEV